MDLKNINSVQDLINMNKANTDNNTLIDNLVTPIYHELPVVGRDVVVDVLENLLTLHVEMVLSYIDKSDAENAAIWQQDVVHIESALEHIRAIQF